MTGSDSFPLRLASPEVFAQARQGLHAAGFDEGTLCRVLNIASLAELASIRRAEVDFSKTPPALVIAIKLFLFGEAITREEFEGGWVVSGRDALAKLDLVRTDPCVAQCSPAPLHCSSPVFLYPVDDFLIASDRQSHPDGSPFVAPPDMVFAAIFPGTRRFLRGIPSRAAVDALDLCSGTGIGALKSSRHARHVIAADITERSAHFTRFNAALNGCANVTASTGDLYGAVAGRRFDCIIAHPPYVPSLGDKMIFRDGGETGETILRRIVEGLPEHLRPGGTFYAMGVGLDTRESSFEARVRGWLGDAHREFDVVFAAGDEKSPEKAVQDIVARGKHIASLDPRQLLRVFENLATLRLVYGALVIRRRGTEVCEPLTARPRLSVETTGDDMEWWLDWRSRRTRPGHVESLQDTRPALSPHLQVKVTHIVANGVLTPAEFFLESSRPFATVTRVDPWVTPLLARFDGQRTAREVHALAHAAEEIPASFGLGDFAKLLALLIERGCLVLDTPVADSAC
jgi:SAM-dependent methyltransferase